MQQLARDERGFGPVGVYLLSGMAVFYRWTEERSRNQQNGFGTLLLSPEAPMSEKPSTTLPGTVEKIIKPLSEDEPEKAQIAIEGADHLYREIRIDNTLTDENGDPVRLKPGAEVEVTVEAPPEATTPASKTEKTAVSDNKA